MTGGEGYYVGLLLFAVFWSVVSAAMLLLNAREANKRMAWYWAAIFAASSLGAAYCFGKLLSGGDAT